MDTGHSGKTAIVTGAVDCAVYADTRSGVNDLIRAIARELGRHDIPSPGGAAR